MPRTLFVARLWFEGNRFAARSTTLEDFRAREWQHGPAALQAAAGTATELGAVARLAAARPDWACRVSRCAAANPGGPIDEAVFAAWRDEVLSDLAAGPADAVYLSLHGAAITTGGDTPDLDLLHAIRAALGPSVPLGASFDLHANLGPALCDLLDFASGYRTYPHVDMDATAARVIGRLVAQAEGRVPRACGALVGARAVLPSFNMRHDQEPMRGLLSRARAVERLPGVIDATLFGGFPYADTAHTGASAMVWAGDDATARAQAAALAAALHERQASFAPHLRTPTAALHEAAARAGQAADQGLPAIVAVTDPADNPLSGGALDTPALLRAVLDLRRQAGSPLQEFGPGRIVFAAFADAGLVRRAALRGPGATLDASIGAQAFPAYGGPVLLEGARVVSLGDGRFVNDGPMERGCAVDAGPCAVLDCDGVHIVVTSRVVALNDPAFYRANGVDLRPPLLLAVKAKNHFHAAFGARCAAIVEADCPGPAAADLSTLPFRRAPVGRWGGPAGAAATG